MSGETLGVTLDDAPLALDLGRLIGSHACIVANSGGGKSGLIRRLLETTHGCVQHVVLDIEDEFYTLRERFDYVIAGGDGGDAPASVEGAEDLALATLTHGFSLIAQLNDLGTRAPEFVGRFLTALIAAPRDLWRPLLVTIDEAQRFAPQDGTTAATAGVKALTAQGRKRGFTAVLASQRIAKIDADVRGDINNWLLGRVGQSLDRRTMADALGFAPSSAEARGLQGLPDRSFWGFGPAISREPVLFRVADVETTPVKPGQAKIPTPPPPEALRAILQGIATATAEQTTKTAIAAYDAGTAAGELLVEKDARIAQLELDGVALRRDLIIARHCFQRVTSAIADIERATNAAKEAVQGEGNLQPANAVSIPDEAVGESIEPLTLADRGSNAPAKEPPSASLAAAPTSSSIGAERKPLAILAGAAPAGLTEASWATLSGYKRSGGTWGTYKSRLRAAGMIEHRGGLWYATAAGVAGAGAQVSALPPPGPELVARWAQAIPGVSRMLGVLQKRFPHMTTRDALAADLGMAPAGGTFGTYLSRLRANGLLEESGKRLRLSPELMERG